MHNNFCISGGAELYLAVKLGYSFSSKNKKSAQIPGCLNQLRLVYSFLAYNRAHSLVFMRMIFFLYRMRNSMREFFIGLLINIFMNTDSVYE